MARWLEDCVAAHSTPMLLLCVGHDHVSGEVHVMTLKDMNDADLSALLRAALRSLESDPRIPCHKVDIER